MTNGRPLRRHHAPILAPVFLAVCAGLAVHYSAASVFMLIVLAAAILLVRSRFAYMFIPAWAGVYLAVGARFIVQADTGGLGVVPLAALMSIVLATATIVGQPGRLDAAKKVLSTARPAVAFLLFWASLPVLGLLMGYPPRTMAAAVPLVTALSFLLLGAIGRLSDARFWVALRWAVVAAVTLGALAGLLQARILGGPFAQLASILRLWDAEVASQYGIQLITGRALGLDVNPNTYGLLGAVGILYSLYEDDTPTLWRAWLSTLSLVIIVLSGSRAVLLGTLAAIAFDFILRTASRFGRLSITRLTVVVVVAAFWLVGTVYASEQIAAYTTRIGSGIRAVTTDAAQDSSVSGRYEMWREALVHLKNNPLGTFGPPQTSLGFPTDNEYLYVLLQGGPVLLALYLLALRSLYGVPPTSENRRFARAAIVVVLVSAVSQRVLLSNAMMIAVWMTAGASIAGGHCTIEEVRGDPSSEG